MKRLLLALLALLVLGSTAVVGQAASLDVRTASLHALDRADRCADGRVTVTAGPVSGGSATGLEVDVPAGCHGIAGMLHLAGVAGATDVPFTFPTSGATATVPVPGDFPPDAVTGVAMTLGGWGVPTSWSYTPPATGPAMSCRPVDPAVDATCTVVISGFNDWGSGYRLDFSVATTSVAAFEWEVRLDLSVTGEVQPGGQVLFPGYPVPAGGWYGAWYPTGFSQSNLCAVSTGEDLPVLRLRGPYGWNGTVSASSPARNMGIQAESSGGAGPESFACD